MSLKIKINSSCDINRLSPFGVKKLCDAIIFRAVKDYYTALYRAIYCEEISKWQKVNELERFFKSDDFMLYSDVDGNRLLREIQYAVRNHQVYSWCNTNEHF